MIINSFQDSKNVKRAVLALHGWTGDEFSMEPIAKSMGSVSAKWYLPRAPYNSDTGKGYTWFSGSDKKGWEYQKTLDMMPVIMENILSDGFSPHNTFILGFSMGAGLAIITASRLPYFIGGVIPIAGFLKKSEYLTDGMTEESLQTPFLMIHGKKDQIVTTTQATNTVNTMRNFGYSVTFKIFNTDHKISKDAIPIIKRFIDP